MAIRIFHNPKCSKSRATLELLHERGIDPEITEYLVDPPSIQELSEILDLLGMHPRELMRTKEASYREAGLDDPGLRP